MKFIKYKICRYHLKNEALKNIEKRKSYDNFYQNNLKIAKIIKKQKNHARVFLKLFFLI
jgi:hypothetical protein